MQKIHCGPYLLTGVTYGSEGSPPGQQEEDGERVGDGECGKEG